MFSQLQIYLVKLFGYTYNRVKMNKNQFQIDFICFNWLKLDERSSGDNVAQSTKASGPRHWGPWFDPHGG